MQKLTTYLFDSLDTGTLIKASFYINSVFGLLFYKKSLKHIIKYEGEKVYFCYDSCKVNLRHSRKLDD